MKKKGITLKIFYITSALLVISALIIYLSLYFLLPNYYYSYKKTNLTKAVALLVEKMSDSPIEDAEMILNEFVERHNVHLVIQNQTGSVIYFPTDRFISEDMNRRRLPFQARLNRRSLEENRHGPDVITISMPIKFQEEPHRYMLTVLAPLQPIDEAAKVIIRFLPYMLIVIGLISMIGAYFYSHLLTKPLLKLNKIAKKMANLDFSLESTINTNDELGELSKSLNRLSINLQNSMNELKQANDQLKDDIQKERDQEQKRREFIATISHELKTPLTAVSGQLEGMIYGIGSYKDRDKYLKQSYAILYEMENLVHEILDVSQLESSYFTPNMQTINLSHLVGKTVESYRFFSEQKQLNVKTLIEPQLFVKGDEKLLSKAISNILSNAVKYSPSGQEIKISVKNKQKKIVLSIVNSGVSIDETHFAKIFEPFYRIEKSRNRKTGGSGLGLYIVKKILEMHKVDYSFVNVQEGVMFTIVFNNGA